MNRLSKIAHISHLTCRARLSKYSDLYKAGMLELLAFYGANSFLANIGLGKRLPD
jgi:hypothetical protein